MGKVLRGEQPNSLSFTAAELKKAVKTLNRIIYASGNWANGTNNLGEGFEDRSLDFNRWADLIAISKRAKIMLKEAKYTPIAVLKKTCDSVDLLKQFLPKSIRVISAYTVVDGKDVDSNPEINSLKDLQDPQPLLSSKFRLPLSCQDCSIESRVVYGSIS